MEIKLTKTPTYIYEDGRVELKCTVDSQPRRIFIANLTEFMDLLDDELNALRHHLTGKAREQR